jgi:hypothetical protein
VISPERYSNASGETAPEQRYSRCRRAGSPNRAAAAIDLAEGMGEASMTQRGRPTRRRIAGAAAALSLAAASAHVAIAAARAPTLPIAARAARALSVNDTGYLSLAHASGSILAEAGTISGTLPGAASVRLDVGSATVTASFTIRVRGGGSIAGTGRARIGSSGRYTSFAGTLTVTGGTGRFAHAHGAGKLYGVIERKSDKLTVQAREGTLDY